MSQRLACSHARVTRWPVVHHFLCAFVGPSYDFADTEGLPLCPKCKFPLAANSSDSEVVGHSQRCEDCHAEWLEEDPS